MTIKQNKSNSLLGYLVCIALLVLQLMVSQPMFASNGVRIICEKEVKLIYNPNLSKDKKEAILILPGFGDSNRGRRHQLRYFKDKGYDLYIPDFIDRNTVEQSMENLNLYYAENELFKYKKVHVFSYIMGAWAVNAFINKYGKHNIATIVYDRSPLQERAPRVAHEKIRLIGRIALGKILEDMSKTKYPPINELGIRIGIIVESKATPLIRFFKKTAMSYGPIDWNDIDFQQNPDDLIYTYLNHDQMYIRFDVIGADIVNFIQTGKFLESSRRHPYDWDVFTKYSDRNN